MIVSELKVRDPRVPLLEVSRAANKGREGRS